MCKTAQEIIEEQDKKKRLTEEQEILALSEDLMNGGSTDPKKFGKVFHYIVVRGVRTEEILRVMADRLERTRSVSDCKELMEKCPGRAGKQPMHWKTALGWASGSTSSVVVICYTILKLTGKI